MITINLFIIIQAIVNNILNITRVQNANAIPLRLLAMQKGNVLARAALQTTRLELKIKRTGKDRARDPILR